MCHTVGLGATPGKTKTPKTKTTVRAAPDSDEKIDTIASVEGMSAKEVLEVVEREVDDARTVMTQFKQQIADIRAQLAEAQAEVESGTRETAGGVSYLELRLQLLLRFCAHTRTHRG